MSIHMNRQMGKSSMYKASLDFVKSAGVHIKTYIKNNTKFEIYKVNGKRWAFVSHVDV